MDTQPQTAAPGLDLGDGAVNEQAPAANAPVRVRAPKAAKAPKASRRKDEVEPDEAPEPRQALVLTSSKILDPRTGLSLARGRGVTAPVSQAVEFEAKGWARFADEAELEPIARRWPIVEL